MKSKLSFFLGVITALITVGSVVGGRAADGQYSAFLPLVICADCVTSGPSWQEVGPGSATGGGISNNIGSSGGPAIAIAPDGTPYVVWADDTIGNFNWEIYVRAWNGNTWAEVGAGSANGGGISNNPATSSAAVIAIDPNGTPYVAWHDYSSGNFEIYVRAWDGSAWAEVGAGSASGGGISNSSGYSSTPSIGVDSDGTVYVAWADFSGGNEEIFVRMWDGTAWEEVGSGSASGGGVSNNAGNSFSPSLALTTGGLPYVAWNDASSGTWQIYMRAWNGVSWAEIGANSASGGGISQSTVDAYNPSMAIGSNGTPYVAWDDYTGVNAEIYVRSWDGNNWVEVGNGSASGGGISNDPGSSVTASLTIDSDGKLYVAWAYSPGIAIYVRSWNGTSWDEVGAGSASGGGISNNSGTSREPSIAVAPDGTPYISWEDSVNAFYTEIYVKNYR